jgi:ATP-binding protein involved in chromosome partitioning
MRIGVPLAEGRLSLHFGHCREFAVVEADREGNRVISTDIVEAPGHQPGVLPRWLAEQGVSVVIAGGMGRRAQALFAESGIEVVVGAPAESPESLVASYLEGTLQSGDNVCDH